MQKFVKYLFVVVFCIGSFILVFSKPYRVEATTYPFQGMIDADSMVIRSGPGLKYEELTQLVFGSKVEVTGESGSYYSIKYDTDKTGYVLKEYVIDMKQYVSTNGDYRTYCDSLIEKGFVESYCPQLYYLHMAYPNWTFTPDVTGLTLEEASKKEESKTVLETGNSNYWLSETPIEKTYYYIKANVIASFMDPRNTMYPHRIFQYLDLQSSKDITNDASMAKIVGSKGYLQYYYSAFAQAAIDNGVNPLHILARSVQEGANRSIYDEDLKMYLAGYSAVTGLYTTNSGRKSHQGFSLDGYYNFYNIGSYQTSTYPYTVQRGLAYAAGFLEEGECFTTNEETGITVYDVTKCGELSYQRPWNTPEKAIIGGAEFIANGYVKKGQDTLYYQKFNVGSNHQYPIYTHQYMTNVMAPNSEGTLLYSAYKAGNLLNSNFNFIIPVYKDLDEVAEPVDKNGDATLKEILINGKALQGFDKDVVEYPYSLQTNDESFIVTATPSTPLTKVEGTGSYTFVEGNSVVTINTTAEDGTEKTYTITVKQVKIENEIKVKDITDKLKVKIDDNIMFGISPGMSVQELINSVSSANGAASIKTSTGEEKTSGKLVTGDIITISGSVENKSFTISIRGDINGDGEPNLKDFVLIQSHILKKSSLSGIKFYSADVNYDDQINLKDFVLVQSHILKKALL